MNSTQSKELNQQVEATTPSVVIGVPKDPIMQMPANSYPIGGDSSVFGVLALLTFIAMINNGKAS